MHWNPSLLVGGLIAFLGGTVATIVSFRLDSLSFAILGGIGNMIAAVLFALCIWIPRRKVDWERIEAEQRLWESGPLGRRWLSTRRRIGAWWKD